MGLLAKILRRAGFVRLRDFNLRLTVEGSLTPIDSRLGVPIDFGVPATPRPSLPDSVNALWPEIPQLSSPPVPRRDLAEGTADDLAPVVARSVDHDESPHGGRSRAKSDTIPDDRSRDYEP